MKRNEGPPPREGGGRVQWTPAQDPSALGVRTEMLLVRISTVLECDMLSYVIFLKKTL